MLLFWEARNPNEIKDFSITGEFRSLRCIEVILGWVKKSAFLPLPHILPLPHGGSAEIYKDKTWRSRCKNWLETPFQPERSTQSYCEMMR